MVSDNTFKPAPTARAAPALHAFSGRDLPWLVDTRAVLGSERVFLAWEPFFGDASTWTYSEFAEETRRYASGLAERGIGRGDFVVLHMGNSPEFMFLWFACARIGAVVVTTNTRSTTEEVAYFLRHCRAKAAITQPAFAAMVVEAAAGRLDWIACADTDWGEERPLARPTDLLPLHALRGDPEFTPRRQADPMLPGSVQYTSGTTARPKGVLWTQANALWGGKTTATHLRLTAADSTPVYLPLFHTNALVYSMMSTLWSGGTLVLMPRFSASRFWDVLVRHGCTWCSMTGFPLQALQNQPPPAGLRMKLVGLGVGDIPIVQERWRARSLGWFGMTETVAQCTMTDLEFPGPPGSMGRVSAGYELAIRYDDGTEAPPGQTGRIWIRGIPGLSIFLQYLNDPKATAECFDTEGWFDTGDLGLITADGDLFYASRAKDMLKVGGENVAALEIETVIMRVPGVLEVAVVGKPDRMRDEVPVAFVVAQAPGPRLEQEILALCDQALADFKRPRQVIFIDELPKGLLEKVLKRELRALVSA